LLAGAIAAVWCLTPCLSPTLAIAEAVAMRCRSVVFVLWWSAAPVWAQGLVVRDGLCLQGHMTAGQPTHMVVEDTGRHRLVVLGRQGETREFDGRQWLLRPGRGPRLYGGLCYQSVRGRVLGFGAELGSPSTWEYDGVSWTKQAPPMQPRAISDFVIAYDSWRGCVVLQGGHTDAVRSTPRTAR
jgi:hypothetical protein